MPHFEIHVTDMDAARQFYGDLFGWSFTPMDGTDDYFLVEGNGFSLNSPFSAALMVRADAKPADGGPIRGGTMTFEVDDCDGRYAWALENGGAEALPPTDYPGIGRCAYVEDGQGNVVGIIKPEGDA